ncbi:MAG TPA: hypothetical protein VG269_17690 [Tepidisphaeraceae bacterium]|jgi:hypothetical protein|nr:hypothetical protein [Tepidisphaeraceae bacterium]
MASDEAAQTTDPDYPRWLAGQQRSLEAALRDGARAEAAWSWARLLAFILMAVIWYPFRNLPVLAVVAVAVALALFVATIMLHRRVWLRREFFRSQLTIAKESAERVGGQVTIVRGGGRPMDVAFAGGAPPPILSPGRIWPLTEQERDDLDFYASPVGLFGLLNRASTRIGAARLRDDLENLRLEPARILARQQSVRWLATNHAQRHRLLAALEGVRRLDDSLAGFAEGVAKAEPILSTPLAWIVRIWTVAVIALTIFAIDRITVGDASWAIVAVLALLINSALRFPLRARLGRWQQQWELAVTFAEGYLAVAQHACADLPGRHVAQPPPAVNPPHRDATDSQTTSSVPGLDDPSNDEKHDAANAGPAARIEDEPLELATLREAFAQVARAPALPAALRWMHWSAAGGLIQIVLNTFALYHVHVLERVHRHVVPHRAALRAGIAAIAELESLLSLASFAAEQPGTTWPQPIGGVDLSINAGTHPLLPPGRAVPNDLSLDGAHNLWLITGSNMSGKSTFLRTAGVNSVLAQAGSAVCATHMRFSPVRLMTDLRIRDNLGKSESYFLAEVRQVRRMILPPEDDAPVLGLVDEPFRGTNHQEQRAATLAIIEHVARSRGMFLIATHDRTVAATIDGAAGSFHFQEELGEKELVFDYRLRPGAAQTRNALRVLEREGYPADLVARAHRWAEDGGGE